MGSAVGSIGLGFDPELTEGLCGVSVHVLQGSVQELYFRVCVCEREGE